MWNNVTTGLFALAGLVWAYVEPIHNLIEVILFVLVCNFVALVVLGGMECWRKHKDGGFRTRWWNRLCCVIGEVNIRWLLCEAFFSLGIITFLFVMHTKISTVNDDSLILDIIKASTYLFLVIYSSLFIKRFAKIFQNSVMYQAVSLVIKRYDMLKKLPYGDKVDECLQDGTIDKLIKEAENASKNKSIDNTPDCPN